MTDEKIEDFLTHVAIRAVANPEIPTAVKQVYNVFADFFTPARVDVQYPKEYNLLKNDLADSDISNIRSYAGLPNVLRQYVVWGDKLIDFLRRVPEELEGEVQVWLDSAVDNYFESTLNTRAIIVWFPQATITNEEDKSVEIQDLYARIVITNDGSFINGPNYKRTTYPMYQFKQGYLHSHSPRFSGKGFTNWRDVCTGSGPINDTRATLINNPDPMIWEAFCWELDKIVHIESIKGVPWFKMRDLVATDGNSCKITNINPNKRMFGNHHMRNFIKYFLSKKCLKFSYHHNSYHLGESMTKFMSDLSDSFIEWYNMGVLNNEFNGGDRKRLKDYLGEYVVKDNKLYLESSLSEDTQYTQYIGTPVLIFKSEVKTLNIIDYALSDNTVNKVHIFDFECASQILYSILRIVNYKYGEKVGGEQEPSGIGSLQNRRQLLFR